MRRRRPLICRAICICSGEGHCQSDQTELESGPRKARKDTVAVRVRPTHWLAAICQKQVLEMLLIAIHKGIMYHNGSGKVYIEPYNLSEAGARDASNCNLQRHNVSQ